MKAVKGNTLLESAVVAVVLAAHLLIVASCAVSGEQGSVSDGWAANEDGLVMRDEDWKAVRKLVAEQEARQDVPRENVPAALDAARLANPDVFGWLYVPGTNVSLALCRRAGDDSYYFMHDSEGNRSVVGAAYVESASSTAMDNPVTAIYGHSFSDADIVFTQLHRFAEQGFLDAHREFFVYLPGRVLVYRVATAARLSDAALPTWLRRSDSGDLQSYFDFATWAAGTYGTSLGEEPADATADCIVQLSTCMLPQEEGARFVVTGVLVEEEVL